MCLTIPARVVSVEEEDRGPVREIVVEDHGGGTRKISAVTLPGLKAGDWVLYTLDTAVRKVNEEEAREIIDLLEPRPKVDTSLLSPEFVETLKKASTGDLSREEIARLLETDDPLELEALFAEANTVRQAHLRDFFCIHGIIEFSNHCVRDCLYCGLRRDSGEVRRYRMEPDELVEKVVDAVVRRGYKLIVLQSGDDFHYTDGMLVEMIERIKLRCRVFIFMSVGERGVESYRKMREAGAGGVLFRFETSKSETYEAMHPGMTLAGRMRHLEAMKEMGFYIATGFLVGLPGQTVEDLADDIITTKRLGTGMVTVGPFVPCDGTPLASRHGGGAVMTLKVIAVSRLLMPKAKIPVTTALETIESDEGRRLALSSGANSLMFNLTPERFRNEYRIYPDKYHGGEELWEKYGLFNEKLSYRMLEERMFEAFRSHGAEPEGEHGK